MIDCKKGSSSLFFFLNCARIHIYMYTFINVMVTRTHIFWNYSSFFFWCSSVYECKFFSFYEASCFPRTRYAWARVYAHACIHTHKYISINLTKEIIIHNDFLSFAINMTLWSSILRVPWNTTINALAKKLWIETHKHRQYTPYIQCVPYCVHNKSDYGLCVHCLEKK